MRAITSIAACTMLCTAALCSGTLHPLQDPPLHLLPCSPSNSVVRTAALNNKFLSERARHSPESTRPKRLARMILPKTFLPVARSHMPENAINYMYFSGIVAFGQLRSDKSFRLKKFRVITMRAKIFSGEIFQVKKFWVV